MRVPLRPFSVPLLRVVKHKHRRSDLSAAGGVTIPAASDSNVG
jgi:hypothetical protein